MKLPPNRINSLMAEKSKDIAGRQEDRVHIITARITVEVSSCPTRLQTPAPVSANVSAMIPEARMETVSIQNLARKLRVLSNSAFCTTFNEPRKKLKAM